MGFVERVVVVLASLVRGGVCILAMIERSLARLVEGLEVFKPILVAGDGRKTQTGARAHACFVEAPRCLWRHRTCRGCTGCCTLALSELGGWQIDDLLAERSYLLTLTVVAKRNAPFCLLHESLSVDDRNGTEDDKRCGQEVNEKMMVLDCAYTSASDLQPKPSIVTDDGPQTRRVWADAPLPGSNGEKSERV